MINIQGRLVANINGGSATENYPIGLIFVTICQHTHTQSLPVARQKKPLLHQHAKIGAARARFSSYSCIAIYC